MNITTKSPSDSDVLSHVLQSATMLLKTHDSFVLIMEVGWAVANRKNVYTIVSILSEITQN